MSSLIFTLFGMIRLRMRWANYVARMGGSGVMHTGLVAISEVIKTSWETWLRWEGGIKVSLEVIE